MTIETMKTCPACGQSKNVSEFPCNKRKCDGYDTYCRDCRKIRSNKYRQLHAVEDNARSKIYRDTHKIQIASYHKAYRENNLRLVCDKIKRWQKTRRLKCLQFYGGVCACCQETNYELLAIDHIDGGGTKMRREIGPDICGWLVRNKMPPGYRVLCHNCNWAIGLHGVCCHDSAYIKPNSRYSCLRAECLIAYGDSCACCSQSEYAFLTFDHIGGGGCKHRAEIGGGYYFLRWLKNNYFPDGYRVLCYNCNMSIGLYGYCPHQGI